MNSSFPINSVFSVVIVKNKYVPINEHGLNDKKMNYVEDKEWNEWI